MKKSKFFSENEFSQIFSKIFKQGYISHSAGDMWEPNCSPEDISNVCNEKLSKNLQSLLKDPTNGATGEFARGYRQALIDIEQELISE